MCGCAAALSCEMKLLEYEFMTLCFQTHTLPPLQRPSESDPLNQNSVFDVVGRKEKESCEPDILWQVSKVLSDVQLARQDWELQCALAETEENHTDMGRLLQSLEATSTASE